MSNRNCFYFLCLAAFSQRQSNEKELKRKPNKKEKKEKEINLYKY